MGCWPFMTSAKLPSLPGQTTVFTPRSAAARACASPAQRQRSFEVTSRGQMVHQKQAWCRGGCCMSVRSV